MLLSKFDVGSTDSLVGNIEIKTDLYAGVLK